MGIVAPFKEGAEAIKEAGGEKFKLCFQCSLCAAVCPWNNVRDFILPRMMREAQLGLADFGSDEWWLCTTCGNCVRRCPRGVEITDVMRAVRSIITDFGTPPASLRTIAASLGSVGNPFGEARDKRLDWAKGLNIKNFTKGMDFLYFVCCMLAYDSRLTGIAQATASVLQRTETNFGILGTSQNCCGESIRKAGNEQVFQYLAQNNIETFASKNVQKIIVSSPHCYTTFKNEYPGLGGDFEVVHFVQYVARLLQGGKLKFTKSINKRVVYHDPCYLGRHNGIYDEPREILRSIPDLELIEFAESRENSLCCGGGGGRIWLETRKEERFSDIRVEQAVELGADILVTACPYCLVNFKDSLLTTGKSEVLEIKDISQLVALALE
jgi:Fe-S oxidoreductase